MPDRRFSRHTRQWMPVLSDPYAPSIRQRPLGWLPSPREPGGSQGARKTPRGIQAHDPLLGVTAPRQLGGNALDKTVHLAPAVFGMIEN